MSREERDIILDAIDTVCMHCVEDTLNNGEVCEECPVRKLARSLENNK